MPFESKAQAAYLHAHPEKVGGQAALKEWDESTDFKHLPERKFHSEHKQMDGLVAGLSEPAHKPKKHQHPKRAKHGIKRTVIEHTDDGGHSIRHEMDNGQDVHHVAPDVNGLKQNMESMLNPPDEQNPAGE